MVKIFPILISGIITIGCNQNDSAKNKLTAESDPQKIYTSHCANCHGEKVEAFVDRSWRYGKLKDDLLNSIKNKHKDYGIISWKDTISENGFNNLADVLLTNIKNVEVYFDSITPQSNIFKTADYTIELDTIATGFVSPWGFAQLPNKDYLVTDRSGVLYKVDQKKNKTIIKNIPKALAEGQGGLLDIELHPNYASNGWVYLSYSKFKEEKGEKVNTTAIVRGKIKDNTFTDQQEIFVATPYVNSGLHFGSRIAFDKEGYLYFSVGERGKEKLFPQLTDNDNGKIHRLFDDGRVPTDNPFVNDNKSRGSIFCYGNRNPQGLALNPATGEIWETEHGPRGGDEINIIKKGANYGWPVISYGINYDGKPITSISKKEGMEQPEIYWIPSIAPSGMTFVNSDKYPAWQGNILVGSLRFKYLNRCIVKDTKIVGQERILINIGRMRNVEMGSDGYIYVSIENPGTVFRLKPVSNSK